MQSHYSPWCTSQLGIFFSALWWLILTPCLIENWQKVTRKVHISRTENFHPYVINPPLKKTWILPFHLNLWIIIFLVELPTQAKRKTLYFRGSTLFEKFYNFLDISPGNVRSVIDVRDTQGQWKSEIPGCNIDLQRNLGKICRSRNWILYYNSCSTAS